MHTPSRQKGVSLIEVLITMVVFSIGVLGVTSLNAVSKRAAYDSLQRSTAAELGFALLEDMRSNARALDVYLAASPLGGGSRGAEPKRCVDPTDACSAAESAAHALWEWERRVDGMTEMANGTPTGGLVSPTVCITGPGGAGVYTVAVVWRGVSALTDPALSPCGAASGLYGAANEFRRMAIVQTYIDPAI